jgi:hypothetical protein
MLLAIDPAYGKKTAVGLAMFRDDDQLHAAFALAVSQTIYQTAHAVEGCVELMWPQQINRKPDPNLRVVIEWPHPFAVQRPKQEHLIMLGASAAAISAVLSVSIATEIEHWAPSKWKGQIPKPRRTSDPYIITERVLGILSPAEAERIRRPKNDKHAWDLYDAVGLGLVACGRARSGVRKK